MLLVHDLWHNMYRLSIICLKHYLFKIIVSTFPPPYLCVLAVYSLLFAKLVFTFFFLLSSCPPFYSHACILARSVIWHFCHWWEINALPLYRIKSMYLQNKIRTPCLRLSVTSATAFGHGWERRKRFVYFEYTRSQVFTCYLS